MPCKLIAQWLENGREQTAERTFDQDRIKIGRGGRNTYVLNDPSGVVSREHATICEREGVWSVCDLKSTNGTILNGKKLAAKQEHELHDDDRLVIGPYRLIFKSVMPQPRPCRPAHLTSDRPRNLSASLSQPSSASTQPRGQNNGSRLVDGSHEEQLPANLGEPDSSHHQNQKTKRISAVLREMCSGLSDALRVRREFQREFEVKPTRFVGGTPNPIKYEDDASRIESILLDPGQLTEEQTVTFLKEVFQDLVFHQLGLMAGLRECIAGLLKEFNPAAFEDGASGAFKEKRLELLGNKTDRAGAAAWRRYVSKYRQVTDEEVKFFERVLAPHLAKGYLSVHKGRKRS